MYLRKDLYPEYILKKLPALNNKRTIKKENEQDMNRHSPKMFRCQISTLKNPQHPKSLGEWKKQPTNFQWFLFSLQSKNQALLMISKIFHDPLTPPHPKLFSLLQLHSSPYIKSWHIPLSGLCICSLFMPKNQFLWYSYILIPHFLQNFTLNVTISLRPFLDTPKL